MHVHVAKLVIVLCAVLNVDARQHGHHLHHQLRQQHEDNQQHGGKQKHAQVYPTDRVLVREDAIEHHFEIDSDGDSHGSHGSHGRQPYTMKEKTKEVKVAHKKRHPPDGLFEAFEFKGFAMNLVKSLTRLDQFGVSFRLPVTSYFTNYDSKTYLPTITTSVAFLYPWETRLSLSVAIPLYVILRGKA